MPAAFEFPKGLSIKAIALNCGVYELTNASMAEDENSRSYLAAYFCDEPDNHYKDVNIILYVTDAFPPAYIMTSSYDFLRNKAKPFYDVLKEKGVSCEYHLYGDENTPELIHVFHCDMKLPEAWKFNKDECRFFDEVMKQ